MKFYNEKLSKLERSKTELKINYELENDNTLLVKYDFLNTYNDKKYFLSKNIPSKDFYDYLLTTCKEDKPKDLYLTNSTTVIYRLNNNEEVLLIEEINNVLNKILKENNVNISKINNTLSKIDNTIKKQIIKK